MNQISTTNPKTEGFETSFDFEDDQMGARVVEVTGKNDKKQAYDLIQSGPFSLWKIVPKKGPVPAELAGQYTDAKQAELAVQLYISKRDRLTVA